jgi:hypothetical protein
MTDDLIRVKVPGDIAQLMKRGLHCNERFYLPWDPRLRTQEAREKLIAHGRQHSTEVTEAAS